MIGHEVKGVQPEKEKLDPAVLKIVMIVLVGALAPLFDSTIVNVAINNLSHSLNSSVSTIQWVITGYLLALSVTVPISGWAFNRFGGKRMWLFSLCVFLAGSVLSAASWNVDSLIVFRIIQGVGAGLMLPVMQNLVVRAVGTQKLGQAMSIVSLPAVLGPILGPVLGGLIINNLSWHWLFLVNIPICLAALILAVWGLRSDEPLDRKQRLDITGLLLLSPAFAIIIYGLAQVGSQGGFSHIEVLIPLASGLVLLAGYVLYALRRSISPVIDLFLFRSRPFTVSTILLFLSGLSIYGAMLLLPLYYQQVRGESVLITGLLMIPQGIGMLLTRSLAGSLTDRIGPRLIVTISTILTALGALPFALAGPNANQILLALALVVRGAGLGGVTIALMATAYKGLSKEQVPHATIATRILQQIGGAFGSAVLAVIVEQQLSSRLVSSAISTAGAYNVAFWWSLGFTALAIIPALLLPVYKNGR